MIKEFVLKGLYGRDEIIKLKFKDKLTIIVGKNGCGKTSTLNIINSIINKNYKELFDYKFDIAYINVDNKYTLIKQDNDSIYVMDCEDRNKLNEIMENINDISINKEFKKNIVVYKKIVEII